MLKRCRVLPEKHFVTLLYGKTGQPYYYAE